MKIGPRIALATSILVALSLGGYGVLTLRARRAELEGDLERAAIDHALARAAPYLALAFPVRRDGQVVGVLEIRRDSSYIETVLREAALRMLVTLVAVVGALAVAVWLIARTAVSRPLHRVLQEISEVARGD